MAEQLGLTWQEAGAIVLTTLAMYLVVVASVRVFGQRRLAGISGVDLGVVLALGAILGRTSLLLRPTLLAGVLATVTLFGVQSAFSRLRRHGRVDRWVDRSPMLLMAGAVPLEENLRAGHVTEGDLRQRLRLAGIRRLDEVRCVILEKNGAISVVRQGEPVDPWLFGDVPGAARLSAQPSGRPTEDGAEHDQQAPPF
jgi:uncharacterized membrane protein YcaP (DUF421 family)